MSKNLLSLRFSLSACSKKIFKGQQTVLDGHCASLSMSLCDRSGQVSLGIHECLRFPLPGCSKMCHSKRQLCFMFTFVTNTTAVITVCDHSEQVYVHWAYMNVCDSHLLAVAKYTHTNSSFKIKEDITFIELVFLTSMSAKADEQQLHMCERVERYVSIRPTAYTFDDDAEATFPVWHTLDSYENYLWVRLV